MLHGINKNTVPLYHVINLIKKKSQKRSVIQLTAEPMAELQMAHIRLHTRPT